WAKRRAARMGPTVCELDGPMPILNRSNTETAMMTLAGEPAWEHHGADAARTAIRAWPPWLKRTRAGAQDLANDETSARGLEQGGARHHRVACRLEGLDPDGVAVDGPMLPGVKVPAVVVHQLARVAGEQPVAAIHPPCALGA